MDVKDPRIQGGQATAIGDLARLRPPVDEAVGEFQKFFPHSFQRSRVRDRGDVVKALQQQRAASGRRLGQRKEEGEVALAGGELLPVLSSFDSRDHFRDPVTPEAFLHRVERGEVLVENSLGHP